MDDGSPGLSVGFEIETGGSFARIEQLEGAMDAAEARITRDAALIERATSNMVNLGGATAAFTAFGNAGDRATQSIMRETAQIERSGEAMVRQLERQNAAFGKTRDELRSLRAEERALAAERVGNTDLARRIREQEAELYDKQLAAARRARAEAEALAEDQASAVLMAAASREREASAIREAAAAYNAFEAAAKRGLAVLKEQQAAEATAAREAERVRERAIAEAAVNAQLLERSRIEAALERSTGVGRVSATDAGATFSALAARAAEEEARATAMAAAEKRRLTDEHERLAAAVRGSHAAQMADIEAAERLRMATDPLYAAVSRLNAEIEESTRLYTAGVTAPAEYARQQEVLAGRLRDVERSYAAIDTANGRTSGTTKLAAHHTQNLAFQFQDLGIQMAAAAGSSEPFKMAMMALLQQGSQIQGIMGQAGIGVGGLAKHVGSLALRFLPLGIAAAAAGVAVYALSESMNENAGLKEYSKTLGLTADEMKKLGDVSVTAGDMMTGLFKTIGLDLGSVGTTIKGWIVDLGTFFGNVVKGIGAATYGLFVGSYRAIMETWRQFPAALGDLFVQAVNGAIGSVEWLGNKIVDVLNWLGADFGKVALGRMKNDFAGSATSLGEAWSRNLNGAVKEGLDGVDRFMGDWTKNSQQAARDRLKKEADKIKADRAPKTDRHAEQLAREAEAIEAQIRNLYLLADAYKVSDGAALIAEARVKAESQAIKQRGDVEAAVDRQVRLSIAQRVADAAKADATTRGQARAQAEVNRMVEQGLIPAERAGELLRERMADVPLLAALEAAQQRKLLTEVKRITQALADQRKARADLQDEERRAAFNAQMQGGRDRLAELREEMRLVGVADMARLRALATIRATQEALKFRPEDRKGFIDQQIEIAETQQRLAEQQEDYNQSLQATADMFDAIDQAALSAAHGISDAFGSAGTALGDLLTVTTGYYAADERLRLQRDEQIRRAGASERAVARENQLYAIRSSSLQVGAFGDMAAAARGFFKEGSTGYRALATAEKVYRVAQLAMSLQAMVQNGMETVTSVANAGARATADGAAGVAAQSKLPFPANIAAMAATAAALVAAGVAVFGGGGGKATAPTSNTGIGTVLGDPEAKSESIRRALDALRDVDLLTLNASREMAASLRSIDSQIGGVASLVVRAGDVNANAGISTGFQKNLVGSVLSKIPVIGGLLGGLFGTKTDIVGGGLFGGPQTLGSILSNGFDASYYSDVKKTKKLFGITTSTKYSTNYSAADTGLETQFTAILREFSTAIGAAAEPLGMATGDIETRLRGFVVDLGKIDLQGLTGAEIEEKLGNVFGAAADRMASTAFPGIERFQKVGEGLFETLVRVSSTAEAVTASLDQLGMGTRALSVDAKVALAGQFENISALTSAADEFFGRFYTPAEQNAAKLSQLDKVFVRLGVSTPATLAAYRALVEAQDLTTAAGQATYATLLQLAPAFADLQASMTGAKSAADILAERGDLERKLLELAGDTAAIRALDLAKLDESNRALQMQVWAIEDAQKAAAAAEDLRKAWTDVGGTIEDEIRRIRGLNDTTGTGSFIALQNQFNAQSALARGGDQDAAKLLPGLSQALLKAAADSATSRQELDRVQAQTAASLEATFAAIQRYGTADTATAAQRMLAAMEVAPGAAGSSSSVAANDDLAAEVRALRAEVAAMRSENNSGNAAIVSSANRSAKVLEGVADASGEAINVANAA